MRNVWPDLRYAVRMLGRTPGFTAAAVLTLALGIGANTATFSFVSSLLLRAPSLPEPERLVRLYGATTQGDRFDTFSYPNYVDLRDRNATLESLAAHQSVEVNLATGGTGSPAPAELVTGNYFRTLGVRTFLGRALSPEDDGAPGSNPVVVVSHGLWVSRLGSDPEVAGRSIQINGVPFTVIGVAPPWFRGTHDAFPTSLWAPMSMHGVVRPRGLSLGRRGWGWLHGTGRLRDGVGREQAEADLNRIAVQLEEEYPSAASGLRVELLPAGPLPEQFRAGAAGLLGSLMAIVGLVLLVACANISSFMMARVRGRQQEIAVRQSLGAGRGTLLRLWLTESLVLAGLAGLVGTLGAVWIRDALLGMTPPGFQNFHPHAGLDGRVLGFSILLTAATGILAGVLPALRAAGTNAARALQEESAAAGGSAGRSRFFGFSILSQVAVCVVLLASAGLLLRSLHASRAFHPGFDADRVLVGGVSLERHGYGEEAGRAFYRDMQARLRQIPGVEEVTLGLVVPLGFDRETLGFTVPGHEPPPGRDTFAIAYNIVGPGYFQTMGIPLLRGRGFEPGDAEPGAAPAVIVNETMARVFWPGEDPLGKTIRLDVSGPVLQVIGVARDIRYYSLGEEPRPYIYGSLSQFYSPSMSFHLRAAADPSDLAPALRAEMERYDPRLLLSGPTTIDELRRGPLFPSIALARATSAFGALTLLLTGLGIFGVVSYSVNRRTREIGIRMTLGARRHDIFRVVLGHTMRYALAGVLLGVVGALAATRLLEGLLFGVTAHDPLAFGIAVTVLAAVALGASYFPARRAARLDPMIALRRP